MNTQIERAKLSRNIQRGARFISMLLETDLWQNNQFGCSSDMWIEDPDRAERCYDASEYGGDGSTHAEVISDMREMAEIYIRDKRKWGGTYRLQYAIGAYLDTLELWHEQNGTLHDEIG